MMKHLFAGLFFACTLAIARSQTLQPEPVFAFVGTNGLTPQGDLVQAADGNFYGTTSQGGTNGYGTVFKFTPFTGALTTLVSFNGTNGSYPRSGLTLGNDGNLYGTTYDGGTNNAGTVFRVTTSGTLVTLFNFYGWESGQSPNGLVLGADGNFYGTTYWGGFDGENYVNFGTVFKITPGGVLTTLTSFAGTNGDNPAGDSKLTFGYDGNLYGVTYRGGASNYGTVFKITPNGTLTSLVSFNNTNGAYPRSGLALGKDGQLYGTTSHGGPGDFGTIFKVTTNGALTTLFYFNNSNGAYPVGPLTLSTNGNFYGTTAGGGSIGRGTMFQITTNGAMTSLLSFNMTIGASPNSRLTLASDGNFYSTAPGGGLGGYGLVFEVTTNGGLSTLKSFVCNGANPNAALTVGTDGNFYGTTSAGGDAGGWGTIFRVKKTDNSFTTLLNFGGLNGGTPYSGLTLGSSGEFYGTTYQGGISNYGTIFKYTTNKGQTMLATFYSTNGANPYAGLIFGGDGNLYGTTYRGGASNLGTVFKVTTNGLLTVIASFSNTNGANPRAALTLGNDGAFYGTTENGGTNGGWGTVYKVTTNGVLTSLVSFDDNTNGAAPYGALVLGSDGNFYGTTSGYSSDGTVFRVTPAGIITTLHDLDSYYDGSAPYAGLTPWVDGCFYGTTTWGGYNGGGTIFKITPSGQFTSVANFNLADDSAEYSFYPSGYYANAALTPGGDGNFYGTATDGGIGGLGTVFRMSNLPLLPPGGIISSVRTSGSNPRTATLTWLGMTNTPYILQYTTNLTTGLWLNLSTNFSDNTGAWTNVDATATNSQRFYRLKH
ncbi:choice-of-anchor tandem repeat GloVer-containing protein [Pedosphaera parvula]|nr:choice-of-anchor tandem repeat GloVer-containing protein [Pedosphaera parvula]